MTVSEIFDATKASALIDTAQQMFGVWDRLSADKKSTLLKRFGNKEKALAALVTARLVTKK